MALFDMCIKCAWEMNLEALKSENIQSVHFFFVSHFRSDIERIFNIFGHFPLFLSVVEDKYRIKTRKMMDELIER